MTESALDGPLEGGAFGETALLKAVRERDRPTIEALLRAGANINQKSHWWAGGFHVLDGAWQTPWLAPFLIERGAIPEIHHLVQLERFPDVHRVLAESPDAVHARGGDGHTPLHDARSIEMADLLLRHGADINARDVDHESTPAQYMIRDRTAVARHLVEQGAITDILMTAALGDRDRTAAILEANPDAIRTIVSDSYFPMRHPRAGGTIYNWTLDTGKSPHEVARDFGHDDMLAFLMSRTPPDVKLTVACELGDGALVEEILAAHASGAAIRQDDHPRLAAAARNNKTVTVALMLKAGWPVGARGPENATALHWAAFHGNSEMVRTLLDYGANPAVRGDAHDGTPLDWAEYGAQHGWQCRTGDYEGVWKALRPNGTGIRQNGPKKEGP
jgi:ankyrin repeat protein